MSVCATYTQRVFSMVLQVQGWFHGWIAVKVINSELSYIKGSRKIPNHFPRYSLGSCWCWSCQIMTPSTQTLFVEGKMGLGEGILEVKGVTALLSYCLYYFRIGSAAETTSQNISKCAALSALPGQGSSCPWKCATVQQQGLSRDRGWKHLLGLQDEKRLELGHGFSSLSELYAQNFSFLIQEFCTALEFLGSVL